MRSFRDSMKPLRSAVRPFVSKEDPDRVVASPDGALSFLFGVFGLLLWYTSLHEPNASELLTAGVLWLILSAGALAAALINMIRGKMRGNINLMAVLLLGFFPGLQALISFLGLMLGFSFSPRVLGLVDLVGSVFCMGMVFVRLDRPAYRSLGTLAVALGLFFAGLNSIFRQTWMQQISGWCFFGFSLYEFYFGLSVMYLFMDDHLPQGPALLPSRPDSLYEYELDEERETAMSAPLQGFSNPSMILAFISAVFGLLNFVSAVFGLPLEEELTMALIRLILGSIHFLAALVLLFQGNAYGNITLIFAVCFALFSGGRKMIGVFLQDIPVAVSAGLYGLLQLCAGLYIAALLPAVKKMPAYQALSWALSGIGLLCFGCSELLHLEMLSLAGGWLFLIFSFLNMYKGLSAMLPGLNQGADWRP